MAMERIRHLIAGRVPAMTAGELAAELDAAKLPDEEFEDMAILLGVTPGIVRAWASGALEIPRAKTELIRYVVDAFRRDAALHACGLPLCDFAETSTKQLKRLNDGRKHDEVKQLATQVEAHRATCPVCHARDQYIADRFGPPGPYPSPLWMRVVMAIMKPAFDPPKWLPDWAQPAATGASWAILIVGFLVVGKLVVRVENLIFREDVAPLITSAGFLFAGTAVVAAAVGGLALSAARKVVGRESQTARYISSICAAAGFVTTCYLSVNAFGSVNPFADPTLVVVGIAVIGLAGFALGSEWPRSD